MSCETFRATLDTPSDLRSPEEQAALDAHLETCADCRVLARRLDSAVRSLRHQPTPLPGPSFLAKLSSRIEADAGALPNPGILPERGQLHPPYREAPGGGDVLHPAGETPDRENLRPMHGAGTPHGAGKALPRRDPQPTGKGTAPWGRRLARWAPAVAALGLLVWVLRPASVTEPAPSDPVRFKGGPAEVAPPGLEMQASIERSSPDGQLTLERVDDRVSLRPDEGLVLRFQCRGGAQLALLEVSPDGASSLLFSREDLDPAKPERSLPLLGDDGLPLRYVPEQGRGTYTLVTLLARAPMSKEQLLTAARVAAGALALRGEGRVDPDHLRQSLGLSGVSVDAMRVVFSPEDAPRPGGAR